MLRIINDLPGNVIGISAEETITARNYETILMPALEAKLKSYKMFRLLYHLGEGFTGFDFGAMFDDEKIALKHYSELERIALVSDQQVINSVAKFFGHMMRCGTRVFNNNDPELAKKWIAE